MHKVGLYIHFPWCKKKCPYCDFNSHPINSVMDQQKYIDALLFDLATIMHKYPRTIATIFMGGGTPSLFSSAHMQQLIKSIKDTYDTTEEIEITCEANPGAIDEEQFAGYFSAGINRLSIGVQSFADTSLKEIGRIHNAENAHRAIDRAHAAGFKRINIDIMYALPQQSIEQSLQDLTEACLSKATHISWYQLTLEPDTYFARFPPKRLSDDMIAEMEQEGLKLLKQHDLTRYEISAYHKANDLPCQHNLNYWLFGDYHAIGAGAHGKITQDNQVIRYHKSRIPKHYLDAPQLTTETIITQDELLLEFMLNALRLFRPIKFDFAAAATNMDAKQIKQIIKPLAAINLLHISDHSFQPTELGYLHLNEVISHFL
jgi:putative oxygen-independent coproporphyrinogen III oxidase